MGLVVCVGKSSLVSMELRWARRRKSDNAASALPRSIPIYISTLKKDINLEELRNLYSLCNHSCNRLSENDSNVEKIVDMKKLRRAISRSDVVVSMFCKPQHVDVDDAVLYSEEESLSSSFNTSEFGRQNKDDSFLGDLFQNAVPLTPSNGQLVGFGRAYSDYGLTASIHDLMVLPSLQRMGIGKLIVNRIVRSDGIFHYDFALLKTLKLLLKVRSSFIKNCYNRLLTSRDIYDIAALCFEDERPFFKACGFGDDRMGSTTMMFTKSLEA